MNPVNHGQRFLSLATLGLAALCANGQAQAQSTNDTWDFAIGAGAVTQPQYPGANHPKTRVLPIASATHGRFAFGNLDDADLPFGASVTLLRGSHWKVAGALGSDIERPRMASDSPRLKGTGNIDSTLLGSIYATYDERWFLVRGAIVSDVDPRRRGIRGLDDPESRRFNSQGTRASIDVEGKYCPTPDLTLVAGPGLVWADSRYQRTFFGIDAAQSSNSGLALHDAGAGVNTLRMTMGAQYRLTPTWNIGASIVASDLQGQAADSPITAKRWQNAAAVTTTFRF
jgi:outer membrane protein